MLVHLEQRFEWGKPMTIQRITMFASLLLAIAVSTAASGQELFRGMTTEVVTANGLDNLHYSPVFKHVRIPGIPYFVDVSDGFDNREGLLLNSAVDGWRNQFLPPVPGLPEGPLSTESMDGGPSPAELSGRWMGHENFMIKDGRVSRIDGDGPTVACVPWVVEQGVGRDYLLEMDAVVAEGETVSLGYFGDVNLFGTGEGLNGELGQMVLDIRRINAQTIIWDVNWDMDGQRQSFTSQIITSTDTTDEAFRLQLGWQDLPTGNDTFDAWLQGPDGTNNHLAAGNLLTAIDVAGIGFEISGTDSYVDNFMAAVPEPTSGLPLAIGLISCLGFVRRKRTQM